MGKYFYNARLQLQLSDYISLVLLRYTKVPMLTRLEMATAKEGRDLLDNISVVITELKAQKYSISGQAIPLLNIMERVCFYYVLYCCIQ